ncbi:UPF0280 family protein [Aquicoccus sp. G2-2]|uniref:UPF0280 family protein n=1 Tax=Aquicoccus sp. G2-2 TaxID=3092120 RepID=UPI002ADF740F|nr:UPF0280 family protein [Aquicoccus sp. G2-2]MEA1113967.1 UPF0280 family protein [Aquicoccus sp. G2-2]
MSFAEAILPGERLHLQHGPIDLIIGVEGDRAAAYAAARVAFDGVLEGLVAELSRLRRPWRDETPPDALRGAVARRMAAAAARHDGFVTPMAAVAGAVADHVLTAMRDGASLRRAYVNNGGDIALWLARGERYRVAVAGMNGRIDLGAEDGIGGIATSGQGGRSLSMGIAESVTVLATDAASADVAATLIANAVDLPGHGAITRLPACEIQPDSDLGERLVVEAVGELSADDTAQALAPGLRVAERMRDAGLIRAAALYLRGQAVACGGAELSLAKEAEHA